MTRETYIQRLGWCIFGFVAIAAILYTVCGSRWFGFYGLAASGLAVLPIFSHALFARASALKLSRIPPVLAILLLGAAAIGQIGFWYSFFNTGAQGLSLGVVRTVLHDLTATYLPYLLVILSLALLWVTARGLKRPRL